MNILTYSPGQLVTIFQEVVNNQGVRVSDGYVPVINRIITPQFTLVSGYPQEMTELDTGLYYSQFILPTGATAVGSYLVDVVFLNPDNELYNINTTQIICNAPYGIYSTTVVA